MLTVKMFCACSGELTITSNDDAAVLEVSKRFEDLHTDEGHVLCATRADADKAARDLAGVTR